MCRCLGFPGHFTPPSLSEGGEEKLKSEKAVGLLDFFAREFCQLSISFSVCVISSFSVYLFISRYS